MHYSLDRGVFERLIDLYIGPVGGMCDVARRGQGASPHLVLEAERELQCTLPPSYRIFLEEHNGGQIPYELLSIGADQAAIDFVATNKFLRRNRNPIYPFPRDVDVVVAEADGDAICIDTSTVDDRGESPVFWITPASGGENIPIANSFLEFFERQLRTHQSDK